jgi:hypothetical protein
LLDFDLGYSNDLTVNFYVDDIKPITWNDEAYSHLVYPEEQKDLVLTFVENHQRMKAGVDDVIMGKGMPLLTRYNSLWLIDSLEAKD